LFGDRGSTPTLHRPSTGEFKSCVPRFSYPFNIVLQDLIDHHNLTFQSLTSPGRWKVYHESKKNDCFGALIGFSSPRNLKATVTGNAVDSNPIIFYEEDELNTFVYCQLGEVIDWSAALNVFSLFDAFDSTTWCSIFASTFATGVVVKKLELILTIFKSYSVLLRQGVGKFTVLLCIWSFIGTSIRYTGNTGYRIPEKW